MSVEWRRRHLPQSDYRSREGADPLASRWTTKAEMKKFITLAFDELDSLIVALERFKVGREFRYASLCCVIVTMVARGLCASGFAITTPVRPLK